MVMLQMQVMTNLYLSKNNFRKNQRNETKVLSRKFNSLKKWQSMKNRDLN